MDNQLRCPHCGKPNLVLARKNKEGLSMRREKEFHCTFCHKTSYQLPSLTDEEWKLIRQGTVAKN